MEHTHQENASIHRGQLHLQEYLYQNVRRLYPGMTPPDFLTYLQWPGDSPTFPGASGHTTCEGPWGAVDRDDFATDTDGVDIEEEIDFGGDWFTAPFHPSELYKYGFIVLFLLVFYSIYVITTILF